MCSLHATVLARSWRRCAPCRCWRGRGVAVAQRRLARASGGRRLDGTHVRWALVLARANESAAQSANSPQDVRKPPIGADLDQRQRRSSRAQMWAIVAGRRRSNRNF
jgi:hypothetical protein